MLGPGRRTQEKSILKLKKFVEGMGLGGFAASDGVGWEKRVAALRATRSFRACSKA